MYSLVINNITKSFDKGSVMAVDNVTLSVKEGELFGLIGPDGAGKTTIFRILSTLLLPDKGNASVSGLDVVKDYKKIRNIVGYMPGRFSLYQDLSVKENLQFFATLFGTSIEKNYDIIKDIYEQIKPFSNRRAGKLSGGMKQKLALSCALIHKPKILFLDEPTTGVDVVSRFEFWEILKKLKSQGITILVSTAYMDEAMKCERIGLIQKGEILGLDTPENIIESYPVKLYGAKADDIYSLLKDLRNFEQVESCYPFGEWLHVTIKNQNADGLEVLKSFPNSSTHQNLEVKKIYPGIEDNFIRLMNTSDHSQDKN